MIKKQRQYLLFFVYSLLYIIITHGRKVTVRSDEFIIPNKVKEEDCFYIDDIINKYQSDEELIIYFPDEVYDMSLLWHQQNVNIYNNIIFMGNENGTTVFNYNNDKRGVFHVDVVKDSTYFKVENITFQNFVCNYLAETEIFFVKIKADDFQFIMDNCTVRNNAYHIFRIDVKSTKNHNFDDPYVLIKNTKFM